MSLYMRQHATRMDFIASESWVILSPIEESIRRKIEAVGTPLKDWDISINYGIKTGYNDAFIISTAKRDEILSNCQTEDERQRTEAVIRPILRGKDIRRYGYDWAGLWLIYIPWHFPLQFDETIQGASEKAEAAFMEQYPSVYAHMLQHKEPLSKRNKNETGIRYEWYAMQRWGANYWKDFEKPKIVWKRVGSILRFSYDDAGSLALDSTCFATGSDLAFLCCMLNSDMGLYMLKDAPRTGTGDLLISVQAVEPLRIPISNNPRFEFLLEVQRKEYSESVQKEINREIFRLFDLNEEEQLYIKH